MVSPQLRAFPVQTRTLCASASSSPENRELLIRNVQSANRRVELDEQATRALIDAQLREAAWEADSSSIRYARGSRPVKGRNLAIAEWPTRSGPADYALFAGPTLLAVVEAKKISADVMSALAQARRYATGIRLEGDIVLPGGPWGEDKLPFIFSVQFGEAPPFCSLPLSSVTLCENSGFFLLVSEERQVSHRGTESQRKAEGTEGGYPGCTFHASSPHRVRLTGRTQVCSFPVLNRNSP